MKSPQHHKSCWELLSALSSRQQAAEQGFPHPLPTGGPRGCAWGCPKSSDRLSVSSQVLRGASWVGAVRQTPRAPAFSLPTPPWRPETFPNISRRAGHWAPDPAWSCQVLTFTESWAWGWGGGWGELKLAGGGGLEPMCRLHCSPSSPIPRLCHLGT